MTRGSDDDGSGSGDEVMMIRIQESGQVQLHLFIRIFWCEHFTKNISRYSYSQISCDLTLGSKLG